MSTANINYLFFKTPSASSVVENANGSVTVLSSNGTFTFNKQTDTCEILCGSPCVPQVEEITIPDVDFGEECTSCPKNVGIWVRLVRTEQSDLRTWSDTLSGKRWYYEGNKVGVVTGADIAQDIADQINLLGQSADNNHDHYGITASVNGSTLVLTGECPYEWTVRPAEKNDAELVFNTSTEFEQEVLTARVMRTAFNKMNKHVMYNGLDVSYFTDCETVCAISLDGCYNACEVDSLIGYKNTLPGELFSGGHKQNHVFYVNSSYPGFADFIAALNDAFTECTLPADGGSNYLNVLEAVNAGSAALVLDVFGFSEPKDFVLSNSNGLNFGVTGVTSPTDLQTQLTAKFPSGTFAYDGATNTLNVSGAFANGAATIKLEQLGY